MLYGYYNEVNNLVALFSSDSNRNGILNFPYDTKFHDYYISNGLQRIDNITANNTISDFQAEMLSIYLFRGHNNYGLTTVTKQKIKYCKIFQDNTLEYNFIPCYRLSDNEIGLYDIENNKFYTNQGTGIFLKGNEATNYESVGDENNDGTYALPITLSTTEGEKMINIILEEPLRKKGNVADYLDLQNKIVVRYIEEIDSTGTLSLEESFSILTTPIVEDIEIENIDFNKVYSISVGTSVSANIE